MASLVKLLGKFFGALLLPLFVKLLERRSAPRSTKVVGNDKGVEKAVEGHIIESIGRGVYDPDSSKAPGRTDADH